MPWKPPTIGQLRRDASTTKSRRDGEYARRRADENQRAKDALRNAPRWRAVRLQVLRREPECRPCGAAGRVRAASQVDHIKPLETHPELAYELSNLQPICPRCHAKKSARERARASGASPAPGGGGAKS